VEGNGYELWVQDRFHYGTEEKWNAFVKGLREPAVSSGAVSIHFLSTAGTAKYGHPWHFAKELNERFLGLEQGELRGWIVVDFGDDLMAARIYSANRAVSENREEAPNKG
jgi:1-phosphatidylinositol phosphodiesterase